MFSIFLDGATFHLFSEVQVEMQSKLREKEAGSWIKMFVQSDTFRCLNCYCNEAGRASSAAICKKAWIGAQGIGGLSLGAACPIFGPNTPRLWPLITLTRRAISPAVGTPMSGGLASDAPPSPPLPLSPFQPAAAPPYIPAAPTDRSHSGQAGGRLLP